MKTAVTLLHEPDRGKNCWLVRWWGEPNTQTGKQRRYSRALRYRHNAVAAKAEKEAALNNGEPRDPVEVRLEELVEDFKAARFPGLSHASQGSYENSFNQTISFFGASQQVCNIGGREAEMFISSRKRVDGLDKPLSSWSKKKHIQNMRGLFAAAQAWGYVENNPFQLTRSERGSSLRITPTSKAWHHLTPAEFKQFLAVVDSPQQRALYLLMFACGLRFGEAVNMRIENVNLANHRVHVRNRMPTPAIPPFTIKSDGQSDTSKERTVPIPESCLPDLSIAMRHAIKAGGFLALTPERYEIVEAHWRLCQEGKPFARHGSRPWQNRDMLNNALRDAKVYLNRAGIALTAPFTLHTFRKSYSQSLAVAGTPVKTLARLLGHSDSRVTLEYYNMTSDDNELAAKRALDRLFAATPASKVG